MLIEVLVLFYNVQYEEIEGWVIDQFESVGDVEFGVEIIFVDVQIGEYV